jgi:uncharacterized GH25 family protein
VKTSLSTQNPTGLIANGHAPWLEMGQSHGHEGENVQLHVQWWPQTPIDNLTHDENVSAHVVPPFGGREEIALTGYTVDHSLRFMPSVGGLYHVILRTDGRYVLDRKGKYQRGTRREYPEAAKAICSTQYAQRIVSVGHHPEGVPSPSGMFLEIRAASWRHWRAGDVLPLTVFHRGEILDGIAVDVVVRGPAGCLQWQAITGSDGGLALRATEPGRYLVIVRYQTPGDEKDVCDELWLTATLSFMVTK